MLLQIVRCRWWFFLGASMRLDDEIRLNILLALHEKNSVKANIRHIKKVTGYHKSTILSSLEFMDSKNLLQGFGPRINFRALGFNLEAMSLFQVDLSKKKLFEEFLLESDKDDHLYWLSGMLSSGTYNVVARHLYKDVESYQKHTQQDYFEKIPGLYDLIKDRQVLFLTEPTFKNLSRTKSIIQILKKEKGFK